MLSLDLLQVRPENVERELVDKLPQEVIDVSVMPWEGERHFLNGLIRTYRPKRVLEIGVYRGGGTCIILNAVRDIPDTTVTSIDLANEFFRDGNKIDAADVAKKLYPDHPRWNLITGKDPVEVIEQLDGPFDFVVLDTAHIHPVESLNFLTIFPYLTPEAVIVLHDINLFALETARPFPNISFANKLLYDSVTAKKLEPSTTPYCRANIGAFQLLPYTKDHIEDVFSMLSFPWGVVMNHIHEIDDFIHRHYSEKNYGLFKYALNQVESSYWNENGICKISIESIKACFDEIMMKKRFIFYGGGQNSKRLIDYFKKSGLRLPDEIWDIRSGVIDDQCGIPVIPPRFDSLNGDYGMVITISDIDIVKEIMKKNREVQLEEYLTLNIIWAIGLTNNVSFDEICDRIGIPLFHVRNASFCYELNKL